MKKILQDLAAMCWIAMAAGVGGTAIGLFFQFRSGQPSLPVLVWLTWFGMGYFCYRVQKGLAILNDRLDKLEKPKPQL